MTLHDFRQAELDRIADKCGIARNTFDLRGDEELHMKPDVNEAYERVDCALRGINESKIPFKLGLVGNEAYITGNVALDGNVE
ncbi:hypothetical protein H9L15_10910 [Sphingomonas daechungensis]|uniref:Uncharacterized protein n=1 Tax=Sphingomonas daechungensis TaxID=1176646 RepID=A0ABX6SZ04_9SPHN|nr:hypothetical protein [Sphingomonas daechungensis]QNP42665.1 hypothetical protein H9L15_10910 [Sphingomonas daechungensis]